MWLSRLEIQNYKSLRDVVIEPGPLSVFVGPNGAGKTNLADAIDFLGDVYRWGLEPAVARKGGYENVCFRHLKRTRAAIRFRVVMVQEAAELLWLDSIGDPDYGLFTVTLDHAFSFGTKSQGIQAPFSVVSEDIRVSIQAKGGSQQEVLRLTRDRDQCKTVFSETFPWKGTSLALLGQDLTSLDLSTATTDLILTHIRYRLSTFGDIARCLESAAVYQLNPQKCREPGVPTPHPQLDRFGGNLPAVISFLQKNAEQEYIQLLEAVMSILPSIEEITTDFTHTKTLGLFVKESGFARHWTADEVSDGILQSIGLLAAVFDPRTDLVVIEEPENSIHPWGVRTLARAARLATARKQIFFTTHSPIFINQLKPEELWIVQRPVAETRIDPLLKLDPTLQESWEQGEFLLSDYLDSGAVPEMIPAVRV